MEYDPNDSWAQVELYRWQHGALPPQDETCKKLDEPTALRAMADAIELGCKTKNREAMPDPYNVCSVMRYVAGKLARSKEENAQALAPRDEPPTNSDT